MDEVIDVVDENDEVIGQETRSKCHKEKILHRGSAILIFKDNSFKEILIQRRSLDKNWLAGLFEFTGGHLPAGSTYLETAKRELQEELFHGHEFPRSIHLKELFKFKKYTNLDYEFLTVFITVYPGPFYLQPEEVDSCHFEKVDELLKQIKSNPEKYTGLTKHILEKYIAEKQ